MKDYQRSKSLLTPHSAITLRIQIPWFNVSFLEITKYQGHGFLDQQWSSVQEAISIQEDACECLTSFWVVISRTEVLLALEARVAAKCLTIDRDDPPLQLRCLLDLILSNSRAEFPHRGRPKIHGGRFQNAPKITHVLADTQDSHLLPTI